MAGVPMLAEPAREQGLTVADPLAGVLTTALGTPGGQGLPPLAIADAWLAVEAAPKAVRATELLAVQGHADDVLAAVDPALVLVPARGATNYGAQRAVREARTAVDAALVDAPLVAGVVRRVVPDTPDTIMARHRDRRGAPLERRDD